ncbi:YidC/Oxa1 family membrane protein insertase [Dehalogenimonas sp. THU2]|uniref:YidC/Oxa1 family membrane protein insertase n=1 Tax=Dehalogenimonas sp. THU2 TaxID=3151121 RepID=UPI0032182E45
MDIGSIWDIIILNPLINGMVWLSSILFHSFGLTVIVLTAVIFAIMYPLTIKQMRAAQAMQELQPKIQALQKKYAKDRQRLAQEQMALMKESGASASGCLVPMVIQMPVWIALYQSIIRVLAVTPEDFLNLSERLYDWPVLYQSLPLDSQFLWINLAVPDYVLALFVGLAMLIQQKMTMVPSTDPKVAAQGKMMLFMMPAMFVFISITFPAGLALYWLTSSILRVIIQFFATGPGELKPWFQGMVAKFGPDKGVKPRVARVEKSPAKQPVQVVVEQTEEIIDERSGDIRTDSGRSDKQRPGQAKGKPGRGGDRRHKRR